MTPVAVIFNHIRFMNPEESSMSSLGTFISPENQQLADDICNEVISAIHDKNSLAYRIASNINANHFSEKQLWVIAYELVKNEEYTNSLIAKANRIAARENAKRDASKEKLARNKENSQSVLDYVKSNGRLLKDYYEFVKKNRQFAKEFFSKRFSMESANAFLNK